MATPFPRTSTIWMTVVVELLPVAVATPVVMRARPSEWLVAAATMEVTEAGAVQPVVTWTTPAVFWEALPMATFPPVLARATPRFTTTLCWMTYITPWPATTPVHPWVTVVVELLPVADAAPVVMRAVPAEVLEAVPVSAAVPPPGDEATDERPALARRLRYAVLDEGGQLLVDRCVVDRDVAERQVRTAVGHAHPDVDDVAHLVDDDRHRGRLGDADRLHDRGGGRVPGCGGGPGDDPGGAGRLVGGRSVGGRGGRPARGGDLLDRRSVLATRCPPPR